jgi:hypothetical protein
MSVSGKATLKGEWFVTLYGEDGRVKDRRQGFNVVTDVGKEFIASFLGSAAAGAATFTGKYIAIGTDATAEAVSNTALGTELSRTTGTASYLSNQIYQVTATFAAGSGTGAIAEYGLLSSSAAGTLIARDTEAVINKGAGDTLTIIAQMTLS